MVPNAAPSQGTQPAAVSFGWSNPLPLGGDFTSSLGMTSWGGDTLHIFGRGTDNNIWYTYYDSGDWAGTWIAM